MVFFFFNDQPILTKRQQKPPDNKNLPLNGTIIIL